MKRLKNTNKHLDLSQYGIQERFDVYNIGNYNFEENLDFNNNLGVYIFSCRDTCSTLSESYRREIYYHTPLYCGMTSNFNKRFNDHFKAEDLMEANCNCISVYYCKAEEDAVDLEKKILSLIKFPFNKAENNNPKYDNAKLAEV